MNHTYKLKYSLCVVWVCILIISCSKNKTTPVPPSPPNGTDGTVLALATYKSNLVAGGYFANANGKAVSSIAQWNGNTWLGLGTGMSGGSNTRVNTLAIYNTYLAAGGDFTSAGGVGANYIALWNGSTWVPLGAGLNGPVNAVTMFRGKLIVGGNFTMAGGVPANYIAQWDGAKWSSLGSGLSGTGSVINALTVYKGELIAAGIFTNAGGVPANNIAQWNDTSWSALGTGVNGNVSALYSGYKSFLVAGGEFTTAGAIPSAYAATWNGVSWDSLRGAKFNISSSTTTGIYTLNQYTSKLIAGGSLCQMSNGFTGCLEQWDSTSWSAPFGNSITDQVGNNYYSPSVLASTIYNGNLVIGGVFTSIGGTTANNIAQWNGTSWSGL